MSPRRRLRSSLLRKLRRQRSIIKHQVQRRQLMRWTPLGGPRLSHRRVSRWTTCWR